MEENYPKMVGELPWVKVVACIQEVRSLEADWGHSSTYSCRTSYPSRQTQAQGSDLKSPSHVCRGDDVGCPLWLGCLPHHSLLQECHPCR